MTRSATLRLVRDELPPLTRDLIEALRGEARLLHELQDTLARQRRAVALNDSDEIDGTSREIARRVFTLEEAKRGRALLVGPVEGGQVTAALERSFGRPLPAPLVKAREDTRRAAVAVAQDIKVNEAVLRSALAAGELFLQQLFADTIDTQSVYQPGEPARDAGIGSGAILNRTA